MDGWWCCFLRSDWKMLGEVSKSYAFSPCQVCGFDSSVPFLNFIYPVSKRTSVIWVWSMLILSCPWASRRRCQVGNQLCASGAGGACQADVNPLCQSASLCCWGEPSDRHAAVCSSARWEQHHMLSGSGLNELDMRCLVQCLGGEEQLHVIKWIGLGNSAVF